MKFKKLFESMSIDMALKVFGTRNIPKTKTELNALYKKLALKCHPDRGGSKEQMQELNDAKETLLDNLGGTTMKNRLTPDNDDLNDRQELAKIALEIVRKYFNKFKLEKFIEHLNKYFNDDFEGTVTRPEKYTGDNPLRDIGYGYGYDNLTFEITNKSRNRVFNINIHCYVSTIYQSLLKGTSFASENFDCYVSSNVFVDGKKQDILKSKSFKSSEKDLTSDPSVLLPDSKLKKIANNETRKGSKVSKRDFVALFIQKYKGEVSNGEFFYLPFNNGKNVLYFYRNVLLGVACYNLAKVYDVDDTKKYSRYIESQESKDYFKKTSFSVLGFYETQGTFDFLDKFFTKIQKVDEKDIYKELDKMISTYRDDILPNEDLTPKGSRARWF